MKTDVATHVHTGRQGRPAHVSRQIQRALAASIRSELLSPRIPHGVANTIAAQWAEKLEAAFENAGLSIVPSRLVAQLGVFTRKLLPADDPSLPKPNPPSHE